MSIRDTVKPGKDLQSLHTRFVSSFSQISGLVLIYKLVAYFTWLSSYVDKRNYSHESIWGRNHSNSGPSLRKFSVIGSNWFCQWPFIRDIHPIMLQTCFWKPFQPNIKICPCHAHAMLMPPHTAGHCKRHCILFSVVPFLRVNNRPTLKIGSGTTSFNNKATVQLLRFCLYRTKNFPVFSNDTNLCVVVAASKFHCT